MKIKSQWNEEEYEIKDKDKCWICGRNTKQLEKEFFEYDEETDGLCFTGAIREMLVCGSCKDMIQTISINANGPELQMKDVIKDTIKEIVNKLEVGIKKEWLESEQQ